jgi:hypothetical protein
MEVREAHITDWDNLLAFFKSIYREGHPLHKPEFWQWQFGDPKYGRSFICTNDNGRIVGHVGANFGGGHAWIINVYLNEDCRGKGILGKLYNLARAYYPLAATAANAAGLGLYKKMRWIRYHDLVRYVKINPEIVVNSIADTCRNITVDNAHLQLSNTHYFRQPGIKGISLGTSSAVSQESVGGLRLVDLDDVVDVEEKAWEMNYLWVDYITSWNDLKTDALQKNGWDLDHKSGIPWRLNPLVENAFSDISFLSEQPLDPEFIVHRSYSDHGRIGSLL